MTRRACSSPCWLRPVWASRAWPPRSQTRSANGRRSSSDRPPPTATASRSRRSSSCSRRRPGDPRETPSRSRRRSASDWSTSPTDRPWATGSPRSSGSARRSASDASWAVRRLLEVLAAERPLVVVLEDVHWAEPPMLDLADAVIERVHGPVLFLCLARPELLEQRPTWAAGKPRAITTTLPPLSPEDARRVAELLLGPQAPRYPSSTGSVRRPRGTPCTWSSSRRCSRIKGSSSTAGGWVPTMPTSRSPRPCRRSSPRGSIDSIPHRAWSSSGHRSRDAGSGSPRSARSPQTSVRKTSSLRSPHSNDEVSCSRRTRPAVGGASRTRSSSRPRTEASRRSCERICTSGSPTG